MNDYTVTLYIEAPEDQTESVRALGRNVARDFPRTYVRMRHWGRNADWIEYLTPAADTTEPGYSGEHRPDRHNMIPASTLIERERAA